MLGECLMALLEGAEGAEMVDRQAAAFVLAETIIMWRRSVTK